MSNQGTGFYMIGTFVMKELNPINKPELNNFFRGNDRYLLRLLVK